MRKRRPIIFKRLGFIAALFVLLAPLALQAASLERSISITDNAIGLIGVEAASKVANPASKWHKATFDTVDDSIAYHLKTHGKGRTFKQYTDDAMSFFAKNKDQGVRATLRDGTEGIKIQTGTGKNKVGGWWTSDGKLVTLGK
ncbi:MAG: hypothetical protein JW923_10920 [Spirochaetales bacterium]|nr:hypothetical protein [Spirochaetales bacterium]